MYYNPANYNGIYTKKQVTPLDRWALLPLGTPRRRRDLQHFGQSCQLPVKVVVGGVPGSEAECFAARRFEWQSVVPHAST